MRRYGVRSVSQVPEIQVRQREGFRKKYGVDHFMQNPESAQRFRATLMRNWGVPSLAFVSRRSSREAQEFFQKVYALVPPEHRAKCYFSPVTHEFNVWHEHRYFKYDFVQSALKRCIEYNGSRFHPKPGQQDDEVGWCLFRPHLTVGEARTYEQHKHDALRVRGYEILVVWDYDVKHDSDLAVTRCIEFLLADPTSESPPKS